MHYWTSLILVIISSIVAAVEVEKLEIHDEIKCDWLHKKPRMQDELVRSLKLCCFQNQYTVDLVCVNCMFGKKEKPFLPIGPYSI